MLSRTFGQCLIDCDRGRLGAIAQLWGLESLPRQRREAAAALVNRLLAPGELDRVWSILSRGERAALASLNAAGGQLPWPSFTRRWGQVRTMGPGRMDRERPWERPISHAERLWYWGLVFRVPAEGPTGLYEAAFLPEELRARLPACDAAPEFRLESIAAPPAVVPATDDLLDDACTLLAYLQSRQVRPGPQGEWPAQVEAALARRWRVADPERGELLRHLVRQLGWLRVDRNGFLRPTPESATAWLQLPTAQQRAALAAAWRDDPAWNDLWHVPTLRPDDTGSWRNDPLPARHAVLRHLGACAPGEWYAVGSLVNAIKELDPDFQRPDGDYEDWYIRDAATGKHLRGFQAWDLIEGALIRYLLAGPLHWLGLVDLGADEGTGLPARTPFRLVTAFRLSPAGAAFLELCETDPEPEPPPVVVQPDLTVRVPAARRYDRFQLNRVADWVRGGEHYVYRLTAGSLERAQQQGITLSRVTSFLERTSGEELSLTLKRALARWARHGAEVHLEPGLLLRVADPEVLQQLVAAPTTRRFVREVLGPQTALVGAKDWPRLVRALVEAGFLPDVAGLESPPDVSEGEDAG
jgi:hypothetical protein